MKTFLVILFAILMISENVVSWKTRGRPRRRTRRARRVRRPCRWGGYGGWGGYHGGWRKHVNVKNYSNSFHGVAHNSNINMMNGGVGNKAVNVKQGCLPCY